MIFNAKYYENNPISLLKEMSFIFSGMLQDVTEVATFPDACYLWIYTSESFAFADGQERRQSRDIPVDQRRNGSVDVTVRPLRGEVISRFPNSPHPPPAPSHLLVFTLSFIVTTENKKRFFFSSRKNNS